MKSLYKLLAFSAILFHSSLAAFADDSSSNPLNVSVGGNFWADDFSFTFSIPADATITEGSYTVLASYWAGQKNAADKALATPYVNTFALTKNTDGAIVLVAGRGKFSGDVDNGSLLLNVDPNSTMQYFGDAGIDYIIFTQALEAEKTYTVAVDGNSQWSYRKAEGADDSEYEEYFGVWEEGYVYAYNKNASDEKSTVVEYAETIGQYVTLNGTESYHYRGNMNGYAEETVYSFANSTFDVAAVSAMAIPEPATATLSLLALVGLAARRRRK